MVAIPREKERGEREGAHLLGDERDGKIHFSS
jgi:hypothetical protein